MDYRYVPNVNSYLSSCSDSTYAYFATYESPARIVRLNKATFTVMDVLTLGANAAYIQTASIDDAAQLAYFGTFQSPGRVAIVDLATFTHNNRTLVLPQGTDSIYSAAIQPAASGLPTRLFFGTGASPGEVAVLDTTPTSAPTRTPTTAPSARPTRLPTKVCTRCLDRTIYCCPNQKDLILTDHLTYLTATYYNSE